MQNDKQQLAAMGEHISEQQQPLCMAKRIDELEAQVRALTLPEGWQLVPVALHALSQEAKESLQAMVDYCLRNGIAMGMDEGFKSYEPEQKHPFRIELESFCAMLAAAPKPEAK